MKLPPKHTSRPVITPSLRTALCTAVAVGCARSTPAAEKVASRGQLPPSESYSTVPFLRTSDTAYVVRARPEVYEVDIPVSYTNRTRDTVWLLGCSFSLERREVPAAAVSAASGWRGAYSPVCIASALSRTPVAPGASLALTLGARGRRSPRARPRFVGTVPGTYRAALFVYRAPNVYDPADLRPLTERVSNLFRLDERPTP
jgi:hypothetical protein